MHLKSKFYTKHTTFYFVLLLTNVKMVVNCKYVVWQLWKSLFALVLTLQRLKTFYIKSRSIFYRSRVIFIFVVFVKLNSSQVVINHQFIELQ